MLKVYQRSSEEIEGDGLLLDTNFLINAAKFPDYYKSVITDIEESKAQLFTINEVILEFFKGSNTQSLIYEKKGFVEDLLDVVLSDWINKDEADVILLAYSKEGAQLSITDLYLASVLKEYSDSISLLTENLKDFPPDHI